FRSNPSYIVVFLPTKANGSDTNPPVVGEINIGFPEAGFVAGNLIPTFGQPCSVFLWDDGSPILSLEYPNTAFYVSSDAHQLTPLSPVVQALVRRKGLCTTGQTPAGVIYSWAGFRRYP